MAVCPKDAHCSKWVRENMKHCLCSSVKSDASFTLGIISVLSWGVAEVPQIMTNYKDKSAEGLSIAFLATWIIGDLFNLFGCMLEPVTLPTQYYTAMLYTLTSVFLAGQAIYYGNIYPKMMSETAQQEAMQAKVEVGEKGESDDVSTKQIKIPERRRDGAEYIGTGSLSNSLCRFPDVCQTMSPGRELYYRSARSLSSSHTPTAGSCLAQKIPPSLWFRHSSIEEPLLDEGSPQSASPRTPRTLLCLVSAVMFLGTLNLHHSANNIVPEKGYQGYVIQLGRKLLEVNGGIIKHNASEHDSGIGTFLGWGMAAVYMGGRIPQIFLNIKRGNVEGLNPLMFLFAVVGNSTYVASILVNSLEWSRIGPNLPWIVDAGGCVLLDTFILAQFIYFRYSSTKQAEKKQQDSD